MQKIVDNEALSAVLEELRNRCLTKSDGEEIYSALETIVGALVYPGFGISIPSSGWESGQQGIFTVYIDIPANVTASDSVDVVLDDGSLEIANECGLSPTVETLGGFLRFRAVSAPQTIMIGEYRIFRGA